MSDEFKTCPCCELVLIPVEQEVCVVCEGWLWDKDMLLAAGENEEGKRYG